MKNNPMTSLQLKKIMTLLSLLFILTIQLNAQTPQFYNTDAVGNMNNFPTNTTTANTKSQWIFAPNTFYSGGTGIGTPAFAGNITTIFIKSGTVNPNSVYTDFTIKLSQNVGTQTNYGSGATGAYTFNSNMTTCFYAVTKSFTGIVANTWYPITLQSDFSYNPSLSLVIEISLSSGVGNTINNVVNGTSLQRIYGSYNGTSGTTATGVLKLGFNEVVATPCAGTPTPGNTISSVPSICPGTNFILSLQNSAPAGSVTYQWYKNNVAISGATNYQLIHSLTTSSDFYCTVTCPTSGLTAYSVPINVPINLPTSCYCIPTSTNGVSYGNIKKVQFETINHSNPYVNTSPYYTNTPNGFSSSATLVKGNVYPLKLGIGYSTKVGAWFDWNQNGIFESSEYIFIGVNPSFYTSDTTIIQNITIPMSALSGMTKMRLRGNQESAIPFTGSEACSTTDYGETEDYILNIVVPYSCSGTPAPGNTIANGASNICYGETLMFGLSNAYQGSNMNYQWYNNNGAIVGATNYFASIVIANADNFWCEVTCINPNITATSSIFAVTLNAPNTCYCIPSSSFGCSGGDVISKVVLNTLSNNSGLACPSGNTGYIDYTNTPGLSTSLAIGATYNWEVWPGPTWGQCFGVWIDYNDNGIFEHPSERLGYTPTNVLGGGFQINQVTIPCDAPLGSHRMRVRSTYSQANGALNLTPCGVYAFGEIEDYTITIVANSNPTICASTLNLNCFLQGYWNGSNEMISVLTNQGQASSSTATDSIIVELHNAVNYSLAYSKKVVLNKNGIATCVFNPAVSPGNYYIVVKHRNTIDTWSASPVVIGLNTTYNFTDAASKAYGSNQVLISSSPTRYAFYTGDVTKDISESIDLQDVVQVENEVNNFSAGYYAEDLNGDGNVDILDMPLLEFNINGFIFSNHP